MGEFVDAGYADRLDRLTAGIHIGTNTYVIPGEALHLVLMYGSSQEIFLRVPQTTLDRREPSLQEAGTISLSHTKKSVKVQPRDGRLYVINADALRDVMHGNIPRATVSEVVYTRTGKPATPAA